MDMLKKIFPIAFKSADKNEFIASLVIHGIALLLGGGLLGLLAFGIPVLSVIMGITGTVLELYCLGGIALSILTFLKVIQ